MPSSSVVKSRLPERFLEILDRTIHLHTWEFIYQLCLTAADLQTHRLFSQSRSYGRSHRSSLPPLWSDYWSLG